MERASHGNIVGGMANEGQDEGANEARIEERGERGGLERSDWQGDKMENQGGIAILVFL